ncbi:MAG: site-2 protease family protein [Clostridiales bacterium]|nr:site-2 protease family protein [Clostridiales bacterium]
MSRWRIATLGGTAVFLHPGVLLLALYAALIGHGWFMLTACLSILLHEAAHALTAAAFRHPPPSLELTPLGAVMRLEDTARLPLPKQTCVLLAGPGMTLLLSLAALYLTEAHLMPPAIGRMLLMCNLSILMMNLLPVLPLDGGQLLSVFLTAFMSLRRVHRVMRALGYIAGIGLIAGNIYASWHLGGWNLSLAFAGCCILYSTCIATTTQAMAELRAFMDRKIRLERKGCLVQTTLCALHTTPVRRLLGALPQRRMAEFVCIEAGSMRTLGRISESQLIQLYLSHPEATLLGALRLLQDTNITTK